MKTKISPEEILARFCRKLVVCDMDIFGLRKQAQDENRWITVHPGGKGPKADGSGDKGGTPVLIDDTTGEIKGGMGGKFTGQRIGEIRKNFVGPQTPTKEQMASAGKRVSLYQKRKIATERLKTLEADYRQSHSIFSKKRDAHSKLMDEVRDEITKNIGHGIQNGIYKLEDLPLYLFIPLQLDRGGIEIINYLAANNPEFKEKFDNLIASQKEIDSLATLVNKQYNLFTDARDELAKMPVGTKPGGKKIDAQQNASRISSTFKNVSEPESRTELRDAFSHSEDRVVSALENFCGDMTISRVETGGKCYPNRIEIPSNPTEDNRRRKSHLCALNTNLGTIRHETFHYLDQKAGWISATDKGFRRAVDSLASPENLKKLRTWCAAGGKYYYNAPVSDFLSAITGGQERGWFGHMSDYWKQWGNAKYTETFANIGNAFAAPDRSYYAEMQKDFPELTKAFEKIIDRLS